MQSKHVFYFSLLFLTAIIAWKAICLGVSAYSKNRSSVQGHLPVLLCEKPIHDFGDIADGQNREHTFQLHVDANESVTIQKISAGCSSCIEILDYSKEPISAQKLGTVTMRLLVQNQQGPISKVAVLKSDDPINPYLVFTLKANVFPLNGSLSESVPMREPTLTQTAIAE